MYAPAAALPALIFGLDLRPGPVSAVVVTPPTVPGIEWTAGADRLHWTAAGKRMHYRAGRDRLHWEQGEE